MPTGDVAVEIECSDIRDSDADVLVLKHADGADGAGKAVAEAVGIDWFTPRRYEQMPNVGNWKFFPGESAIRARQALFIGVEPIPKFGYDNIRRFSRRAMEILRNLNDDYTQIAYTIHGPGYGLDEREAFESQLAGISEAIKSGSAPRELSRIKIVERNQGRADRLRKIRDEFLDEKYIQTESEPTEKERSVGYDSESKPHVFVAMPFDEEFDDVYYTGIKPAVKQLAEDIDGDILCERVDENVFTGSVTDQIRDRIESASLVVADMTNANPNVYLEVGYAWGSDVPVLLLTQDTDDLEFDVEHHNSLIYDRMGIHGLKQDLKDTLAELDSLPVE
jgi:hypothetical protein